MLKKILICIFGIFLAFTFMNSACFAAGKGNYKKGKFTYRQVFKACNARGEIAKAKPPLNPSDKTQSQWERIFEKKRFNAFGCEKEWSALGEKDLLNIYSYLYKYAADSPSPAKCQ